MKRRLFAALAWTFLGAWTLPAGAQSVVTRSPNVVGGWTAAPGVIQLNFLHRFSVSDAPLRKVINTPTFNVGTGLTDGLMVGFVYGSNSALVPAYPNEWEIYTRALPVAQGRGAPLDVALQAGYNLASESIDGELLLARSFGRVRLLGAARAFSKAYDGTETRYALTGGASLGLTPSVSLSGDWGALLDGGDDEKAAWSAGLQIGVPYTPHSFSIHASNVGTASLEGTSRGSRTRWGFEYTVPITLRRYVPSGGGSGGGAMGESRMATDMREPMRRDPMEMAAMAMTDTVVVDIRNLAYTTERIEVIEGTTVLWRNQDPVQHSITSYDEAFDSGLIEPDASWAMTFGDAGEFPFHCTPHPFMTGTVVVSPGMDGVSPEARGGDR